VMRAALLGAILVVSGWAADAFAAAKPNVILIVADDQHRDQANYLPQGRDEHGRPRNLTPHIDRLAREGVVLAGLHSPSPLCVPSRFALLTGNYASRATNDWMVKLYKMHGHTFVHQEPMITPDTPNLARDLKRLGYTTLAVGKNHVIQAPGYRKVDARNDIHDPNVLAALKANQRACIAAYQHAGFDYAARIYETNPVVLGPPEIQKHNLDWINKAALEMIDEHHDRPFFLYYAVTVPHRPYLGYQASPLATPVGLLDEPPQGLPPRETIGRRLTAAGVPEERGDLLWLDDCVGSLVARLDERGVLENTVIFYVNDHGDDGGKTTCYQGGMRTFGFVWAADERLVQGARVAPSPTSLVDIAPTIVSLAGGAPAASRFDGVDLAPLLAGKTDRVREMVYGEMGHTRAVIKGDWKYIALRYSDYHKNLPRAERLAWLKAANEYQRSNRWTTFEGNDPGGPFGHSGFIPDLWDHEQHARAAYPHFFDANQLYHLKTDPREQRNLAGDPKYAEKLAEMKAELQKRLQDLPGGFAEFKPEEAPLPMQERIQIGRELMKTVFH